MDEDKYFTNRLMRYLEYQEKQTRCSICYEITDNYDIELCDTCADVLDQALETLD